MHQLVPDLNLILVDSPNYSQCIQNALFSFANKIFQKRIIKNPLKKLTSFLLSNPVSFLGYCLKKWKGPGISYQLLFRMWNIFKSFVSLVIRYLVNFDPLIERGFWVLQEITTDNLRKPPYGIIIIPFLISF